MNLHAAYAMAIGLGLRQEDASEGEVFERWAKLKEVEQFGDALDAPDLWDTISRLL